MPSVDVLINIHTTYFSCLDMLVTSVRSLLTLEPPANSRPGGIPLFVCINPRGSDSTPAWEAPAEGPCGHPPLPKRGSEQAGCSHISNRLAAECCSHGCGGFATRTNSQGKSVADSSSLEVIERRQDVVLGLLLESETQVIGLNMRGIG